MVSATYKKHDNSKELTFGRWYALSQEYVECNFEDGSVRIDRDTVENSEDYLEFTTEGKVLSAYARPSTFKPTKDSLIITVFYDGGSETIG